jgi:hypothetical protein
VNDRAGYLVWRLGLEALVEALSGKLETIAALPPAAAMFPWTGEKNGDRPRDLFGFGANRVHAPVEARELAAQRPRGTRRDLAQRQRARRPAKAAKPMRGAR